MKDKTAMDARNWLIVFSGIGVFFLGLIVMALVGKDHHGLLGFLAPFFLISGLSLSAFGMVVPARDS